MGVAAFSLCTRMRSAFSCNRAQLKSAKAFARFSMRPVWARLSSTSTARDCIQKSGLGLTGCCKHLRRTTDQTPLCCTQHAHLLCLARATDGEDTLRGVARLRRGLLHVGLQCLARVLDAAGVEDVEALTIRRCLCAHMARRMCFEVQLRCVWAESRCCSVSAHAKQKRLQNA